MLTTAPTSTTRRFIVLLFSFAVLSAVLGLSECQATNGSQTGALERDNAQNAVDLARQFKAQVREKLWQIYNGTHFVPQPSANQSVEGSCFDRLTSALNSPLDTAPFEWLMQMYDSSGGVPSGLLQGTTISLGDFDQCLRITAESDQFEETQYCLLTLQARRTEKFTSMQFDDQQGNELTAWERDHIDKWLITDNKIPIAIGLCLPATCNEREKVAIGRGASSLAQRFDTKLEYCQHAAQDGTFDWLLNLLPLLVALTFLAFIVSLGTLLDFLAETQVGRNWSAQLNHFGIRLLRCFSLIANTKILFNVKSRRESSSKSPAQPQVDKPLPSQPKRQLANLDILDGIRVFTILWIIMGHCSSFTQVPYLMKVSPLGHFPWAFFQNKEANWLVSSYLVTPFYPVSIFFMVSGILVLYNYKRNRHCDAKQHFFRHLMMRVFRLSPTLLATIGLTYYMRYIGSGPLFHQQLVEPYVGPCKTHFWFHLFFLHNFLPLDQRCGSHTWYVAADFQLNVLAFVIVHLIRCRAKWFIGLLITLAIIATSGIIPLALVTFGFGQIPNFDAYVDPQTRLPMVELNMFYYASYVHAGPFFMGVILGYLLSSGWDFSFLNKNKLIRFGVFNTSCATMMVIPLAMRYFVFPDDSASVSDRSPLFTAILFQFFAYTFNFAMAAFIFVCALNPTLYMSQFLSASCLRPISRMVFSAYLSHQVFIWFTLQQTRYPVLLNVYTLFAFTTMIITATSMSSIALYLLVECPFMRIGKLIFPARVIDDGKSKAEGPLMMQSISTVEAYSQSRPNDSSIGVTEPLDNGSTTELQSISVRQSHQAAQSNELDEDGAFGGETADQNNNSQFTSRPANAIARNGHGSNH